MDYMPLPWVLFPNSPGEGRAIINIKTTFGEKGEAQQGFISYVCLTFLLPKVDFSQPFPCTVFLQAYGIPQVLIPYMCSEHATRPTHAQRHIYTLITRVSVRTSWQWNIWLIATVLGINRHTEYAGYWIAEFHISSFSFKVRHSPLLQHYYKQYF